MKIIRNVVDWRFDVFERYQFCTKHLSKENSSILEIGAGIRSTIFWFQKHHINRHQWEE